MQLDATLTAAQRNVLHHLAAGKSVGRTAELCGVHRNTIANWRREIPAFALQLDEATRERCIQFQELMPQAIEVCAQSCTTTKHRLPSASALPWQY